jgi:hypothetical protein
MTRSYIECDECKNKQQTQPAMYGGHGYDWIFVTRSMGNSDNDIPTGELTFCSDKCIKKYVNRKVS